MDGDGEPESNVWTQAPTSEIIHHQSLVFSGSTKQTGLPCKGLLNLYDSTLMPKPVIKCRTSRKKRLQITKWNGYSEPQMPLETQFSSSSCVCIKSHNWSAKKWLPRQQIVAESSCHLTLSEYKSRQYGTSFVSHRRTQISGCLIP